uniref:Putative secreted peptide n=1 Tax=Anopheles braziliensis TaxID=58242 RepID=A0A2M3ZQP1_9DIPT
MRWRVPWRIRPDRFLAGAGALFAASDRSLDALTVARIDVLLHPCLEIATYATVLHLYRSVTTRSRTIGPARFPVEFTLCVARFVKILWFDRFATVIRRYFLLGVGIETDGRSAPFARARLIALHPG